jgi:DNA-binding response OmpR family regulator
MTLLGLLVSSDDSASDVLGRVLPAYGIALERFSDLATAIDRCHQQRFDALIVDFDDAEAAAAVFEESRRLNSGRLPVTVALVQDLGKVRAILSGGAHFVLYKPLSEAKARAGLRAVAALLNRERRRSHRVPVQAPVELILPDNRSADGILLDLSETGMEILTAEPRAAGDLLQFRFQLTDGSVTVHARGQAAWANSNGQTGVHFLELDEATKTQLKNWVQAASGASGAGAEESVPHCKLTDLSLGGCYLESDSPFPERALVDLCLRTEDIAVHTEGLVRVTHPGYGMGIEFPSRTLEQRARVGDLIGLLRSSPESMLHLIVSPRALTADVSQYEHSTEPADHPEDDVEDPLLELLRRGSELEQEEFLEELRHQRSGESVAT